jgi:hypothetical protein
MALVLSCVVDDLGCSTSGIPHTSQYRGLLSVDLSRPGKATRRWDEDLI